MSDALVREAFETRLKAWADAQVPPIQIAYQNKAFTPPAGRYVRCHLIPAPTLSEDWAGEHRLRRGVFQVDLCVPSRKGPGAATALAESLDAAFPLTGPMTQGSIQVYLLSPMSQGPALQESDHYVVPVSCTYRSDTI